MKVLPWTPYSTALLTAHPACAKILVERGADNSASSRDAHNLAAGPLDIRDVFENLAQKTKSNERSGKGSAVASPATHSTRGSWTLDGARSKDAT